MALKSLSPPRTPSPLSYQVFSALSAGSAVKSYWTRNVGRVFMLLG